MSVGPLSGMALITRICALLLEPQLVVTPLKAARANESDRAVNVRNIFYLPWQFGGEQEGLSTTGEDDSPGLGRGPVPFSEHGSVPRAYWRSVRSIGNAEGPPPFWLLLSTSTRVVIDPVAGV